MALYPRNFGTKDTLSPGARGETFQTSIPGYRDGADRVNRTNNTLNTSPHDVPTVKYELDRRLPALFKYGFAYGYNQIVIPKGRIVGVDKYMEHFNYEMMKGYRPDTSGFGTMSDKAYNVLTIANGGAPVTIRRTTHEYPAVNYVSDTAQGDTVNQVGKEWAPLLGYELAYTADTYRPFLAGGPLTQLRTAGFDIDQNTGKVIDTETGDILDVVRPGNIPVGIMFRNEYTRDDDALNGMTPGAVLTDCMVELPWFYFKDKAEQNPWGSAYGNLFPGALVKSDENGRFVVSPLSFAETLCLTEPVVTYVLLTAQPDDWATKYKNYFTLSDDNYVAVTGESAPTWAADTYYQAVTGETPMTLAEYELERQQVVGQVYAVNRDLLPEGAARWATWALSDRMNYENYNPDMYPRTNRNGEDSAAISPYQTSGNYPGYPFEESYLEHDLHMMNGRPYDARMNMEHDYSLGIPGLTDGYNAVNRFVGPETAGKLRLNVSALKYEDIILRTNQVDINSLSIIIDNGNPQVVTAGAAITVPTVGEPTECFKVKSVDELRGIVVLEVTDKADLDTYMSAKDDQSVTFKFVYRKRGLSGVPTFMDWDGCLGSVKILLTI